MNNIHKDCFGYQSSNDTGCTILKHLYCKTGECKFYKTDRDGKYPWQAPVENKKIKDIEI